MSEAQHEHPWYVAVFVWLFVLTVVEVAVAEYSLGWVTMFVVLSVLALIKAALVALYFMHLKFERLNLIVFVFSPVLATLLLLLALYVDALRIGLG